MKKTAVLLLTSLCFAAQPVFADPPEGKRHGKPAHAGKAHKSKSKGKGHGDDRVLFNLGGNDRDSIRDLLMPHYRRHCPPGLAKKTPACIPPGQAKKYSIGQPLPRWVDYWPVPGDVLARLPAAPHGAQYVWVDRDILLISEATKKVLDAAVILSGL